MATIATPTEFTASFANNITSLIEEQLNSVETAMSADVDENPSQGVGGYDNNNTVISFQTALDQFALTKVDVDHGQLTTPTMTDPRLLGTATAPTAARAANNTLIATTEFVSQAITDTLTGLGSIVPVGTIAMWSGSLALTPAGWAVCDGTNGTPDLRGKFVLGANSTITSGSTGGTANAVVVSHSHGGATGADASHTHTFSATTSGASNDHTHGTTLYGKGGSQWTVDRPPAWGGDDAQIPGGLKTATTSGQSQDHSHTLSGTTSAGSSHTHTISSDGESGTGKNLPPYYALYYIMKLADVVTPPTSAPLYVDTTNARVGVNTSTPTVAFDVVGASKLTGHTTVGPIAGSTSSGNQTSLEIRNNGGTGDSDVAAMSYHCAGYYGIHQHLRADGYFGVGGWSATTWRWYVNMANGDMTAAGNITAYSDPRLKENITPIESALSKVLRWNGVRYRWKDNSAIGHPGAYDYGVLSSDIKPDAPELVVDSVWESPDGDMYKTVAYAKLTPFLIEAIKEQQAQIDELKKQVALLQPDT